jgi:hypothetical protein
MLSKSAYYVGFGLLLLGVVVGIYGAVTPISSPSQKAVSLVNTSLGVDPNDYATQNLQMVKGQTVNVSLSIDNQTTTFTFDVMNQTQYYIWYGCAPTCHQPLLGGNGTYYERANETTPYLVNVTVSSSSPYSTTFSAPSNGTYYFVFDNSIGQSWDTYLNHNATGYVEGKFALSEVESVSVHSVNWIFLGIGSVAMLAGGSLPVIFWEKKQSGRRK